jgi:D-alanine-D-alanine ligase-like ATP-grasp enzyme
MTSENRLQRAILLFESRAEWTRRHINSGLHADHARALPPDDEIKMLHDLIVNSGLRVEIHELMGTKPSYFKAFLGDGHRDFIFWNLSDGEQHFLGGLTPALCQLFGWPYFGSRAYTQGLCQHKDHWKSILHAAGVETPQWRLFMKPRFHPLAKDLLEKLSGIEAPHFVKAAHLGNSAGFSDIYPLSASPTETVEKIQLMFNMGFSDVLVEEYIDGSECTVGAAHFDQWETITFEQIYAGPFIDQAIKDQLPGRALSQKMIFDPGLENIALQIISTLGLKDYCRIDLRLREQGTYTVIDVNCAPFMTGWTFTSLSQSRGSTRPQFYRQLLEKSFERQQSHYY